MITDVVVHNGLEGVATGTFVCMVGKPYGGGLLAAPDHSPYGLLHNPYPLLDWINLADSLTCRFLWTTKSARAKSLTIGEGGMGQVYKCLRKVRPLWLLYLTTTRARPRLWIRAN